MIILHMHVWGSMHSLLNVAKKLGVHTIPVYGHVPRPAWHAANSGCAPLMVTQGTFLTFHVCHMTH